MDEEEIASFFDGIEMSSPAPWLVLTNHGAAACAGRPCCIHNPSDHHMADWPLRFASKGRRIGGKVFVLSERSCYHHVGHPDPDSLMYAYRLGGMSAFLTESLHICCEEECCRMV